ncbi:thymidylate synthase [Sphingorhabdus sp. IMCC26285]|uniref:Thymidylate synthase n=1 Tax=Sphingorhabdus profundilacus TaxID=2509718 RepID=A0A6I4M2M4_9SPHN|nr:thymidylate synthase [Sphingorhabdus profundilacus]MVZ96748.1 thymidylate synthase [Sphingorhabdus profundilacus]
MEPAPHYEDQYLALMRRIWTEGTVQRDRTGVGTRAVFGAMMRFSLADDAVPLLTTKRVYWKTAAREMLWFLTGNTNIRPLLQQKVRIWTDWPLDRYRRETGSDITQDDFEAQIVGSAEFAEKWGDLGPVYGAQWVNWPNYQPVGEGLFQKMEKGIDQVSLLVESLKNNPGSRRHIIEGWNVAELDRMALPPCHKTYQFHVADGVLSCILFQRSCDLGLGFAFNAFSAALLIRMLANVCGYQPGELIWQGGDVHLYLNHSDLVEEQLSRTPSGNPKLKLLRTPQSIFDFAIEDFEVVDYTPQSHISAPVAV